MQERANYFLANTASRCCLGARDRSVGNGARQKGRKVVMYNKRHQTLHSISHGRKPCSIAEPALSSLPHPCCCFCQASVHLRRQYRGNLYSWSSSKLMLFKLNSSKPRLKRTERLRSVLSLDVGGSVQFSKRTIRHGFGYSRSTRMPTRSRRIWR